MGKCKDCLFYFEAYDKARKKDFEIKDQPQKVIHHCLYRKNEDTTDYYEGKKECPDQE